jgi:putative oxidoreductase
MSLRLDSLLTRARSLADRFAWVGPLLVRISLGAVFIPSGWGKLHNLAQVTDYFVELGIPMPGLNATVTSVAELVGGTLILFGLFTRVTSLPLAFMMLVATVTAKRAEIDGIASFFGQNEMTYLTCFVWLAVAGAGAVSLDRLFFGRRPASLPKPLLHPPTVAERA